MMRHVGSRCSVLFVVAGFGTVFGGCDADRRQGEPAGDRAGELVVVSYGGAYQAAQRKAFFEPFAERNHVNVREETWTGDFAAIEEMVESGNVTWDVVAVEAYMVLRGAQGGLLEEVEHSKLPGSELLPEAVHDYGVATAFWSTVLAYNTVRFSGESAPANWADLWDVQRFPGPRTLRRDPVANLEIALLAAGVPKDELYPLDVDLAFQSLDRIKDHVTVWWEAGGQPADLLGSGDVVLGSAWNGRVHSEAQAGRPVAQTWEGGIVNSDWWVIPRGARNVDVAQDFLAFASSAGPQAELARNIPYGPVNTKATEMLSASVLSGLPTAPDNLSEQVMIGVRWWTENQEQVSDRWEAWLSE